MGHLGGSTVCVALPLEEVMKTTPNKWGSYVEITSTDIKLYSAPCQEHTVSIGLTREMARELIAEFQRRYTERRRGGDRRVTGV